MTETSKCFKSERETFRLLEVDVIYKTKQRHDDPMVGAMDPYWGSLHCVRTLIAPLLTQRYKWILVT